MPAQDGEATTARTAQGAPTTSQPVQDAAWPAGAFRYEVRWRPAGEPDAPDTVVSGQYRDGAWQQTAQTGTATAQEMLTVGGKMYTRPAGETTWTRWPGPDFDAAYGLASPFTVLRLFPLVQEAAAGEPAPVAGAGEATLRKQTRIAADSIAQVLDAGVAAVAPDAVSRATMTAQVGPAEVQQTVTYWVGASGRIYRAAATLLTQDIAAVAGRPTSAAGGQPAGAPAPWIEITWRFWDYEDPGIAIRAPTDFADPAGAQAGGTPPGQATPEQTMNADLTVHVFAAPGIPAQELAVTVYGAGNTRQPLGESSEANASFNLPAGRYDVRVQMDYADEWLHGLPVSPGQPVSRNVVFDFGTLRLSVKHKGVPAAVDIVTYPAGDRANWVDWRSDNPATIALRAGQYDVEIASGEPKANQTIKGLVIKPGEVTAKTVELP
jgi:hypothetical protein